MHHESSMPIAHGEYVEILPEYQDPGDSDFVWRVIAAEEKGRLTIQPQNSGMRIAPSYVVQAEWVRVVPAPFGAPTL